MRRLEGVLVSRSADVARALGLMVVCGCGVRMAQQLKKHDVPNGSGVREREACSLV